jgi:DNA repair protein RadA/Sms
MRAQLFDGEVYLNIAGGYRVQDPAADLAVAAALVSALSEKPVPVDAVAFGEVALSGEVRAGGAWCAAAEGGKQAGLRTRAGPAAMGDDKGRCGCRGSGRWASSSIICWDADRRDPRETRRAP